MGMFDLGIGGLLKGFNSFMHPEKGYEKAQNQYDKYYGQAQGHLQPYEEQGQQAYGNLNEAMQQLMNPSSLYDKFMNDYHMSDSAKFNQERTQQSGLNALSSMGMLGSTPAIQAMQGENARIGADDEMRYMKQMIEQYMQGANVAQGIYGQGAQAAGQLSQNASNMGSNSAEAAFGKQNAPGNRMAGLLQAGLGAMGAGSGGGAPGGWNTGA
jgi:hypothetical protein